VTWRQRGIVGTLRGMGHRPHCIARAFRQSGGRYLTAADVISSDDPHPTERMTAAQADRWLVRRGGCTCAIGRTMDD